MDDVRLAEYRKYLNQLENKSQELYDKTVLSLSGGALGISFTFIDKIVAGRIIVLKSVLLAAWVCWGVSLAVVLFSFLTSQHALRKAIRQVDMGKIYSEDPGGIFDKLTKFFNIASGSFFLSGVVLLIIFIINNMG